MILAATTTSVRYSRQTVMPAIFWLAELNSKSAIDVTVCASTRSEDYRRLTYRSPPPLTSFQHLSLTLLLQRKPDSIYYEFRRAKDQAKPQNPRRCGQTVSRSDKPTKEPLLIDALRLVQPQQRARILSKRGLRFDGEAGQASRECRGRV